MGARLNLSPRAEWQPAPRDRTAEPREHRCARCWGPFGKSQIPCPNEPKPETKETDRDERV
jgi:hypothetical protein